jgi:uncharacterized membrane protein YphA (DoxX/SURF4 family)
MESTDTQTAETARLTEGGLANSARLLRVVYGLVPIVAGADKFTNLLVDWTTYLPAAITGSLPVEPVVFMYVVGVIEIVAGALVFTSYTREAALLVAAWLVGISVTLLVAGQYDVAVRDLVMAVGAYHLAMLSG